MAATDFLETLKSASEVELAVKRSGTWTRRPVWFVVDGNTIYLLPVHGTDTKWYTHFIANPEIELSVKGKKIRAQARTLLGVHQLTDVINRFRSKYGDLERYYTKLDVAIAVTV
jgi:uncharacterized pyridoxamine 5'-phosphate oxidase family protein